MVNVVASTDGKLHLPRTVQIRTPGQHVGGASGSAAALEPVENIAPLVDADRVLVTFDPAETGGEHTRWGYRFRGILGYVDEPYIEITETTATFSDEIEIWPVSGQPGSYVRWASAEPLRSQERRKLRANHARLHCAARDQRRPRQGLRQVERAMGLDQVRLPNERRSRAGGWLRRDIHQRHLIERPCAIHGILLRSAARIEGRPRGGSKTGSTSRRRTRRPAPSHVRTRARGPPMHSWSGSSAARLTLRHARASARRGRSIRRRAFAPRPHVRQARRGGSAAASAHRTTPVWPALHASRARATTPYARMIRARRIRSGMHPASAADRMWSRARQAAYEAAAANAAVRRARRAAAASPA